MAKKVHHYITKEGLEKLRAELEYLKTVKASEIAGRLKEAISYGDLKENSEYHSAREEELLLEARVREIEEEIMNAEVYTKRTKKSSSVEVGSTLTVQNQEDNEKMTFTIVGSTEMDPLANKFSNESELGSAVIGREAGEVVSYKAPKGLVTIKILSIE